MGILVGPDASILTNWLWSFLNAGIQVCCSMSGPCQNAGLLSLWAAVPAWHVSEMSHAGQDPTVVQLPVGVLQPSLNAVCHVSQPLRQGGTWHAR